MPKRRGSHRVTGARHTATIGRRSGCVGALTFVLVLTGVAILGAAIAAGCILAGLFVLEGR